MVVRDVRKTSDFKVQPFYSVLMNSMGTNFHESIFTAFFYCFCQHLIEPYDIWRGVGRWDNLFTYSIFHRRNQRRRKP